MRKLLSLSVLLAACGGTGREPFPLTTIPLPRGAALSPYDPQQPGTPHPYWMVNANRRVYVSLGNLRAVYSVGGPGMVAEIDPQGGVTRTISLGGVDGKACQNTGVISTDGTSLFVACGGDFNSTSGRAVAQIDLARPDSPQITTLAAEDAPAGMAVMADRIWLGLAGTSTIVALARSTTPAHVIARISLSCPQTPNTGYGYAPDLAVVGNDLYALCSSDIGGTLFRLDATTGAERSHATIGATPTSLAVTSDARIAVVCSGDNTLWLGTPTGGSGLTAALLYTFASGTSTLQGVRAQGRFLYTTASGSNTVQKIDPSTTPAKVVAEQRTGTAPWDVALVDEDRAIVSNSVSDDLSRIDFSAPPK